MPDNDLDLLSATAPDGAVIPVSQLDNAARETRRYLKDWAAIEHDSKGRHIFPIGDSVDRPITDLPGVPGGNIFINEQTGCLEYFDGVSWISFSTFIPPGTRVVFDQDVAPVGWTRDVAINDRVIRLVSGARAHGGSWTISGLSHTHSFATPAHKHDSPIQYSDASLKAWPATQSWPHGTSAGTYNVNEVNAPATAIGQSGVYLTGPTVVDSGGTTAASSASDGTWRPLHRDMIIAEKNALV